MVAAISEEKRVFIGVPTHNNQIGIGTARCLARTGTTPSTIMMQARSLLCINFNDLLCQAVNSGATHFCLLHSDIEIDQDDWIDEMLKLMSREQVDVLSVASPIKNTQDFSCGISDANCYKRRRFSREDLAGLPPTFKTTDVRQQFDEPAGVMIFNTGCLMMRLSKIDPVVVAFQMIDKIERKNGKLACDNVPEDWFFSVVCHKLAIPYACTREIRLLHSGFATWSNEI